MIGCCRGDPVNVDVALATQKGIPVFHAPGRNADAVADLTLAFMLMLTRRLPLVDATYRNGRATAVKGAGDFLALYKRLTGFELGGLTIGLVALGAVGREVAARLVPFKARVLAYDPYVTTHRRRVSRWSASTTSCASRMSSRCMRRSRPTPCGSSRANAWR
jgi:autoinducer 2 (AI-2) kinase